MINVVLNVGLEFYTALVVGSQIQRGFYLVWVDTIRFNKTLSRRIDNILIVPLGAFKLAAFKRNGE